MKNKKIKDIDHPGEGRDPNHLDAYRSDAAWAPAFAGVSGKFDRPQPTISASVKNWAISRAAFSALSEPWTEFSPTLRAKSLRMVPGAA